MANGKAKGSEFEREICKYLSVWINGIEKPYIFWRSPSSGALATIAESMDASGDIIALRPEGKFLTDRFSLELKNGYPDADFEKHFKDTKNNTIEDFWKQCTRDARKVKKWSMLIFKKKGCQTIIGIESLISLLYFKDINLKSITLTFDKKDNLPSIIFYDFKQFFNTVTPKMIENISIIEEEKNEKRNI